MARFEILRRKLKEQFEAQQRYSVSGNGVAYRKASSYLKDKRVNEFLRAAEKEA
jgi:hypothetical protein